MFIWLFYFIEEMKKNHSYDTKPFYLVAEHFGLVKHTSKRFIKTLKGIMLRKKTD